MEILMMGNFKNSKQMGGELSLKSPQGTNLVDCGN